MENGFTNKYKILPLNISKFLALKKIYLLIVHSDIISYNFVAYCMQMLKVLTRSSVKGPILLLPIDSGCALRVRTGKWLHCL